MGKLCNFFFLVKTKVKYKQKIYKICFLYDAISAKIGKTTLKISINHGKQLISGAIIDFIQNVIDSHQLEGNQK